MRTILAITLLTTSLCQTAYSQQVNLPGEKQAQEETRVFTLKNMSAEDAVQLYRALFNTEARVSGDMRTNSLVFRGTEAELADFEDLILKLDAESQLPKADTAKKLQFETKSDGKSIDRLRAEYQAFERFCPEYVKRRKDKGDAAQFKQGLQELVEQTFDARQALQRAEAEEQARRLDKIRQTIETREGLKAKLVQRRIDELMQADPKRISADPVNDDPLTTDAARKDLTRDESRYERSRPSDPLLTPKLSTTPDASNQLTASADLLSISPMQLHDRLEEKSNNVIATRQMIAETMHKVNANGGNKEPLYKLQPLQDNLKQHERLLRFAKLQYDEIIKYLETSAGSVKSRLQIAQSDYERLRDLYQKNSASQTEVMAAMVRPQELEVELQRVESLLKLYTAAGDIPELQEALADPKVTFVISGAALGQPTWLEGNGAITASPTGMWAHLNAAGQATAEVARIQFTKIPNHENTALNLKIDVPERQHLWKRLVWSRQRQDRQMKIDIKFSEEELQNALKGQTIRKFIYLKMDDAATSTTFRAVESSVENAESAIAIIELSASQA